MTAYAVSLVGFAPLLPHLDLPVQVLFTAALVGGFLCDRYGWHPFSSRTAALLACILFSIYALQVTRTNLVLPVVNILALLMAVRLLSRKTPRHYLQIFTLAIFALAGSSLLTLSMAFFFFLILMVVFVTIGLVFLSFYTVDRHLALRRRELKKLVAVSCILPVFSLVLMLAFFIILPRTQQPLWYFLNPVPVAAAGFSEEVKPGSVSALAALREISFRVQSERLAPGDLYWRGIVLNQLQGQTWIRGKDPSAEKPVVWGGRVVHQTIYPEPRGQGFLFALDVLQDLAGVRGNLSADRVFPLSRPLEKRIAYQTISALGGNIEVTGQVDLDLYLQIPELSTGMLAVVQDIKARGGTDRRKIALLEEFFLSQNLVYATTELSTSVDPLDEFLFVSRRGYCEFFASSFALMLRAMGIPARLVGGYYGGEYNDLGKYYIVTEDAAHVWVEALVDAQSWLRIDPTTLARNPEDLLRAGGTTSLAPARQMMDAFQYHWNRAVINFDLGTQVYLFHRSNVRLKEWRFTFPWKIAGQTLLMAATLTLVCALAARRWRQSREERILGRYLRAVRKKYRLGRFPPAIGLRELADRTRDPHCREFADLYGGAVYSDRKLTDGEYARLGELVRNLRG
jgi:protein-glutamine gamma-glutamyltransferase